MGARLPPVWSLLLTPISSRRAWQKCSKEAEEDPRDLEPTKWSKAPPNRFDLHEGMGLHHGAPETC